MGTMIELPHVVGSPYDCIGLVVGVLEYSGDPKVSNLYEAIGSNKDIGGLDIPMKDLIFMDVFQCHRALQEPIYDHLLS